MSVATVALDRDNPAPPLATAGRPTLLRGPLPASAVMAVVAVALAATGRADGWLVVVTLLVARLLSDRRHSILSCLAPAVLLTGVMVVAVLTVAGLLDLHLLSSTPACRLVLLVLTCTLLPWIFGRRHLAPGRWAEPVELLVCLPAAVLLTVGAWLSRQTLPDAVGGMLAGWDASAHALASAALARTGDLSYATDAYPRGVHALVSLVLTSHAPLHDSPDDLAVLLRATLGAMWVLQALLTATVALATLRLAVLRGLARGPAVLAATGAGLLCLTPSSFSFAMGYGFLTTIALAFVLATVTLELLCSRRAVPSTLLLAAAVTATAHTYQIALPAVAVPVALRAVQLLRGGPVGRWPWAACGALAAVAVPPAWSVVVHTGVGTVGAQGAAAPLPVLLLVAGLVATACLGWRQRGTGARELVWTVASLLAVAVVTAWLAGASLNDYYPRKLLWHVALLTVPVTATGVAAALVRHARRTRHVPFLRLSSLGMTVVLAAGTTALAVPGPYSAASGGWSLPDGVVAAVLHPQDQRAACALDGRFARQVVARLMHFYDPVPTLPPPQVAALPTCARGPSED